jgi:hypothetical protein
MTVPDLDSRIGQFDAMVKAITSRGWTTTQWRSSAARGLGFRRGLSGHPAVSRQSQMRRRTVMLPLGPLRCVIAIRQFVARWCGASRQSGVCPLL